MLAPTPTKTFIKTQQKTKINRSKTTAESNTKALAATKAHPIKNPAIPPIIPVLHKPQTPLPTVTGTANPNQIANTARAMQLIKATAKTTGVQNQLITPAIPAATTYLPATVQLKQQEKPIGQTAVTTTITTTPTAVKKPQSTNPILLTATAAVFQKTAATTTTILSLTQLGTTRQIAV